MSLLRETRRAESPPLHNLREEERGARCACRRVAGCAMNRAYAFAAVARVAPARDSPARHLRRLLREAIRRERAGARRMALHEHRRRLLLRQSLAGGALRSLRR